MRRIVFTKPWQHRTIEEVAERMAALGVDGIELPVRPGYQVPPDSVTDTLPRAVKAMEKRGIEVVTVAADPTDAILRACADSGVTMIRTMIRIDMNKGYATSVADARRMIDMLELDSARTNDGTMVRIGVQNHCDYFVGSAVGLMDAIEPLSPHCVCAVLDLAHCSLDGEPTDMAIDICWPRLGMVNLKSAYRRRRTAATAAEARWSVDWTTARDALYSWSEAIALLKARNYRGDYCLPAEYSDPHSSGFLEDDDVLPHLEYDLEYLDSLLA